MSKQTRDDKTELYGMETTFGAIEKLYYWSIEPSGRLFWMALKQQCTDEHDRAIGHARAGQGPEAMASLQFEGAIKDYIETPALLRNILEESGILESPDK